MVSAAMLPATHPRRTPNSGLGAGLDAAGAMREAVNGFPAGGNLRVLHINGGVVVRPVGADTPIDAQPLSAREREVLALVAEGYGNKQIGHALHISERTVKNHLTGIMTKLRASDRTHAVVTAVRLGWLAI